ncbi:hypothetical protein [Alienimonas sp. DA493]|uniref:hypothetical protein n=1 Tax=Alienimonas sp. DA493 TaxID=3373605 RepID=UPI00375469CF
MHEDLEQRLDDAEEMPAGPARTAAFAEIARHADAANEDVASFRARLAQLDAAMLTSQYHVALALFPRLLQDVDADPARFDDGGQLIVTFPTLLTGATCFPDVPLERLRELEEEFARRGAAEGLAEAEILSGRLNLALATGELDRARDLLDRMSNPWSGHFARCEHCRVREWLYFHWYSDDLPSVRETGRRLIDGRLKCTRYICHGLMEPFALRAFALNGDDEDAVRFYRTSVRVLKAEPHRVHVAGLTATFLAHVLTRGGVPALCADSATKALRQLLRRAVHYLPNVSPDDRMQFLTAAALALEALTAAGAPPALPWPDGDPLADLAGDAGRADPAPLIAAMNAEAERLSLAFDRRNGNDFHVRLRRRDQAFAFGEDAPSGADASPST